jgi:HEPN domain-containing protein
MRLPEEVKQDLVRQWLAKADEDLSAAQTLLSLGTAFFSTIGFHCQQAAEKYFKAFLIWQQIEFPKTHDLSLLLGLISTAAPSLAESLEAIAELTSYGVEIRYPGDVPKITKEDATEAVRLAENVREAIQGALAVYCGPVELT